MGRRRMQVWLAMSSWGSLRPSRKKCPSVCDWVGLKVGAFLGGWSHRWGTVACRWDLKLLGGHETAWDVNHREKERE